MLLSTIIAMTLEPFVLYRFTQAGIFAIAIMGINILTGISGQFSIGHSAFVALGAYSFAMSHVALPVVPACFFALALGCLSGFMLGWPALRLGTVHLALSTWGLALAVPQLLKSSWLEPWTGGVQGLYIDRPSPALWFSGNEDQWWFIITILTLLMVGVGLHSALHGKFGQTLRAVRDNEIAAASLGIHVAVYKTSAFSLSAGLCALAGALAALLTDFIAPDTYTVFFGILLLVGAVLGGIHSIWGAITGGLIVEFLPDLARDASASVSFPLFGLLLIALIWVLPNGLSETFVRLMPTFMRSHSKKRR